MFYSDGVYTDDKCVADRPNLAVAVVGYGTQDGVYFEFSIKNKCLLSTVS